MVWKVKQRLRYALIEQDTENPRRHRGRFYAGPRHVKHHRTKEFVEFAYVLDPDFASESDCRAFAQNANCAIEVYDYHAKLFNPDYETVSVHDERFDIQFLSRERPTEVWESVSCYDPRVEIIPLEDGVEIRKTFNTDYGVDSLVISYILRTGSFLKHRIVFTNKTARSETFRVIMKLAGVTGTKVTHIAGEDIIEGVTFIISPFICISDEHVKLCELLWDLGEIDEITGEWTPTLLKGIVFDIHAEGCEAEITIGNYTLASDESLEIDPVTSTFYIPAGENDGYITSYSSSYSTALSGGAFAVYTTATRSIVGQFYSALTGYYYVNRSYLKFDTTSIPANAEVTAASLNLYGQADGSDVDFYIQAQKWTGDVPIDSGDWPLYDGITYGQLDTANFILAYNEITITDLALIIKAGYTKICLRSSREGTTPSAVLDERIYFYNYEQGSGYIPYLEVTYTVGIAHTQTVSEILGMVDSVAKRADLKQAVAESIGLLDSALKRADLKKAVVDQLGIVDSAIAPATLHKTVEEKLGILDITVPTKALVQEVAEVLGLVDSVAKRADLKQAAVESLGLLDQVVKRADLRLAVAEPLGILDQVAAPGTLHIRVEEPLGLLDEVAKRADLKQTLIEKLGAVDSVAKRADLKKAVEETLGLVDSEYTWRIRAPVRILPPTRVLKPTRVKER